MKVYKVFLIGEWGQLYSTNRNHEHHIQYTQGIKAVPTLEGSKLFAFTHYREAVKYFRGLQNDLWNSAFKFEVWECETDVAIPCHRVCFPTMDLRYRNFWEHSDWRVELPEYQHHDEYGGIRAAKGVVACDWVVPVCCVR